MNYFEISLLLPQSIAKWQSADGRTGAFGSGVLAVAVATPCTAPFMGVAVGYGLTTGGVTSFFVFTALAIGFALPFILLALFPTSISFLPKPGQWMVHFKTLTGFPLLATCLWLLWVLELQAGSAAVRTVLMVSLGSAFLMWLGRFGEKIRYVAAVVALVMMGISLRTLQSEVMTPSSSQTTTTLWRDYTEEALKAAVKQSHVFVDFTAAWCVSCQVNKKLVLDT